MIVGACWLVSCEKTSDESASGFSLITAAESGLFFENTIEEDSSLNVLSFEYIYNGGGVGVGDFNEDGYPDLVFTGNQVRSRLYLNDGDLTFRDASEDVGFDAPHWTGGVAIGDVNGDGKDDVYLCNVSPNDAQNAANQLFLNRNERGGALVFEEVAARANVADTGYSTQAAFLDYDLDGDLDIYLLRNAMEDYSRNSSRPKTDDGTATSNDRLLRNDGNDAAGVPHFTDVSRAAGILAGGWGLGVCVGDVNGDGFPDVYCANDFLSNDLLWVNQGDDTFRNEIASRLPYQGHNSMGVDIADYDNSLTADIVTVDMMPEDNLRQKTMFPPGNYRNFSMNLRLGYQPQFVRNMLYTNVGAGVFLENGQQQGIYATDWSWSPLFADLDNDGLRDLYVTNGYVKDITDLDFLAYNQDTDLFGTGNGLHDRIAKTVNGLRGVKKTNRFYHNDSERGLADRTKDWGLEFPSFSNGAAYADLDRDGDLDLVVNNINQPAFLLRNDASPAQNHYLRLRLRGKNGATALGTKVTLYAGERVMTGEYYRVRGYLSTSEAAVHFGLGATTAVDSVVVRWPGGTRTVLDKIAVDTTHQLTLPAGKGVLLQEPAPAIRSDGSDCVPYLNHLENEYYDFDRQPLTIRQFSAPGPALLVADLNGDGANDLVFQDSVYLRFDSGFAQGVALPATRGEAKGYLALVGDEGGAPDLLRIPGGSEWSVGSEAYVHRLYLNNGRGDFSLGGDAGAKVAQSTGAFARADLDGDGQPEIFLGGALVPGNYPARPTSYLLSGDRKIELGGLLGPSGLVTAATTSDLDGDGLPELVVATEYGPLRAYRFTNGTLTPADNVELPTSRGWWASLTAADFDGDGDQDLIAGNYGNNNRFAASPITPVRLHRADYDANGTVDPVLTRFIDGKSYPVAPRDLLTKQIPGLRRRFSSYQDFGSATFADIFTAVERRGEITLEADELRSLYLENRGDGTFRSLPLPNVAQLAPLNDGLAYDWNGDGHLDFLAVTGDRRGNTRLGYQVGPPLLVLLGDGRGGFTDASPPVTDWRGRGDGRNLSLLETPDCGTVLITANNNGRLETYRPPATATPLR